MLQYVVHGGWWMVYGCQQSAMSHRPSTIDCTLKLRLFAVGLIIFDYTFKDNASVPNYSNKEDKFILSPHKQNL